MPGSTGSTTKIQLTKHVAFKNGVEIVTLTGNVVLDASYGNYLQFDPGGSARDVTLPAEETSNGMWYEILNTADAAENLVVKDDAGSTVVTISQNEKAKVVCDAGGTWSHMGIVSIALS
jgi:hypothetical protein